MTNSTDDLLKPKRAKAIVLDAAATWLPDFDFLAAKRGYRVFQRRREAKAWPVFEIISISFPTKGGMFDCAIASRLNKQYIFESQYNSGLINPHKDLKVLKYNVSALPLEQAYCSHDGREGSARKVLDEIFHDIEHYGKPFLEEQFRRVQHHPIVIAGLEFIKQLRAESSALKQEIEQELADSKWEISRLKHPLYISLKKMLQSIPG